MFKEIYVGNIKECLYSGYAGNIFGIEHEKIIEQGVCLVKVNENEYVKLDELLSNNKKNVIKKTGVKKGDLFVSDLVLLKDLIDKDYLKTNGKKMFLRK